MENTEEPDSQGHSPSSSEGNSSGYHDSSTQSVTSPTNEVTREVPSSFVPYLTHQPSLDQMRAGAKPAIRRQPPREVSTLSHGAVGMPAEWQPSLQHHASSSYTMSAAHDDREYGPILGGPHTMYEYRESSQFSRLRSAQNYAIPESDPLYQEYICPPRIEEEGSDQGHHDSEGDTQSQAKPEAATPRARKRSRAQASSPAPSLRSKKSRGQLASRRGPDPTFQPRKERRTRSSGPSMQLLPLLTTIIKHESEPEEEPGDSDSVASEDRESPSKRGGPGSSGDKTGDSYTPQQGSLPLPLPLARLLPGRGRNLIRSSEISKLTMAYSSRKGSRKFEPAVVQIVGDLNDVTTTPWTAEEKAESRRLVVFHSERKDGVLKLSWVIVSHSEYESMYGREDTVVSCIWDSRSEAWYITSADILAIMECLVGAPIFMSEKNRLRRNLEYAKPLTVSKAGDFSSLFALIMSYKEPRPRKIVKDTKVVKWDSLAKALHKLVSKYSIL